MELDEKITGETSEPGTARIVIRDAKYIFTPRPEIEHIIHGIVTRGSVNLFVGMYGSKKTWSLISAAVCSSLNREWVGHMVKQGNVLIIDEESGDERLSRRLAMAIRGEYGTEETSPFLCKSRSIQLAQE